MYLKFPQSLLAATSLSTMFAVLTGGPALAQQTAAPADETAVEAIVITGSRIKLPGLTATSPIASVGSDTIALTRAVTVEDFSTRIPQLGGGVNSSVATTDSFGAQTLDLRGLGQNRTLVLVNGTRIVPFGFRNSADVSAVPATLLKRVDVLTGGAGAVYGADAIAGVVNFIINDDFRGVKISGNYRTADGGGAQYGANGTFGLGLGDRGSVVAYVEYTKRDPLLAGKREFALARPVITAAPAGGNFRDATSVAGGNVSDGRAFDINSDGVVSTTPVVTSPTTGVRSLVPQRSNFTDQLQLIQSMKRINASVFAKYELTDAVEAYGRFMYSNIRSTGGNNSGTSGPVVFSGTVPISSTNPGLTPEIASRLTFVNGVANVIVNRPFPEFGLVTATNKRVSWQGQLGLRGDLTSAVSWDAYVQHGQVNDDITVNNQADRAAFLANVSTLDIFGPNSALTTFRRAFSLGDRTRKQSVAAAFVSGDSSDIYGGWAGPIGFSAGFEHRRDVGEFNYVQNLTAVTFGQGSLTPPVRKPKTVVNEVYGELLVPILADIPLIQKLNLEGAFRRSWYTRSETTKSANNTSKIGANWTVSDDLRLRATRQIVIREPNIGEFANGVSSLGFGPDIADRTALRANRYAGDPCVIANSGANLAQCAAFGAPAVGSYNSFDRNLILGRYFFGGNETVRPEKGKTFTVGGVATPRFLPGLNVSLDYYNIKIDDAIGVVQPIDALASCYVLDPRAGNPLCAVVTRNPTTGRLQDAFATDRNLATLKQSGIDLGITYAYNVDSDLLQKVTLDYQANFTLNYSIQRNAAQPAIDCTGRFGGTCSVETTTFVNPAYRHRASLALDFGAVTSQIGWTRIGKVQDSTLLTITDTIPAINYFDLNLSIKPPIEGVTLNVGVNNLFDKQPPQPRTAGAFGTFPESYDVIGRSVGLSLTIKR
jgi:iron complex outermembrane recepter protein